MERSGDFGRCFWVWRTGHFEPLFRWKGAGGEKQVFLEWRIEMRCVIEVGLSVLESDDCSK